MERGSAAAALSTAAAGAAPSAKRMRISSADDQAEGAQDLHRMLLKEAAELDSSSTSSSTSTSTSTSSSETTTSSSSSSFEAVVQDEVRYRACRHAPLPPDVARTLQTKAEWGRGAAGAHQQRCAEEAVQRKQAELDRTNHLYKALARKSFQLSVTLLNQSDVLHQEEAPQHAGARPPVPSSATTPSSSHPSLSSSTASSGSGGTLPPTTDIHRTIVLPAAMPLAKLHKTLQTMVGWQDTQKYMFMTADGVPIAKYSKDDIPCLSDSKIRLAYIVKDSGDEFYYQYGEWVHRLVVETIGAPRRNIPSTRVISGSGQCPPDGSMPSAIYAEGETQPFSVDAINAQLMAGQTFYMRIPAGASKDHEELVCLRAMRTPVNILTAPSNLDAVTSSSPSSEAVSSVMPPNRASASSSAYSAPTSAGLSSIAPSPPVTASSHHHAAADRFQEYYQSHGHHGNNQQPQARMGESSWDPAAFMSMPSSGSLPGHYPSALQHSHDLMAWRDETEQQHRHVSAPSFFPSSAAPPSSNGQSGHGAFSSSLPSSSLDGWPSSPFSMSQRSLTSGVPSLPPSSSSYPPSESEDGDEVYYARDRYPPPSAYHNHHQHSQQQHPHQQHSRQQSYQHQQTLFPHYESSRASFSTGACLPSDSSAASSLAQRAPSAHLLPFPSHTLPPFPSYLASSPAAGAAGAGALPGSAMRSRSPSPLFPPPSSFGGLYPLPPSSTSSLLSSSLPHDLMLCPSPSTERLPPLSGTAALLSPDSPLPPFSSSSSSLSTSTSTSSSPASATSLPPFPMSSSSSSFSMARAGFDGSAGHHYQSQPNHHQQQHPHPHQQQQHHYHPPTSGYAPSRSGGSGGPFVVPSPTFPPSFLLSRGSDPTGNVADGAAMATTSVLQSPTDDVNDNGRARDF